MDKQTLLAALDFSRNRLIGTLDALEKSGQDPKKVLGYRPGPGRAHLAWQFLHCAATHDRYLNVRLLGGQEKHPAMVKDFGGGSTPSDTNVPGFEEIRSKLEATYKPFRDYVATLSPADFDRQISFPNNVTRSLGEAILMMVWHESHHQGQIHITWNMYKAANGVS